MSNILMQYTNPIKERFDESFFKNLPNEAGVYFFSDEQNQLLYIGKADHLKKRLMSYRLAKPGRVPEHTLELLEQIKTIQWEIHSDGKQALAREKKLIQALKPPFNTAGTDPIEYLMLGIRYPE